MGYLDPTGTLNKVLVFRLHSKRQTWLYTDYMILVLYLPALRCSNCHT